MKRTTTLKYRLAMTIAGVGATSAQAATFTWNGAATAGTSNWSAGPWTGGGGQPNAVDDVANLTRALNNSVTRTLTLDGGDKTVGTLTFNSGGTNRRYLVSGSNQLIFDVSSGSAALNKTGGASNTSTFDEISAPVHLNDNLEMKNDVAAGNARIVISGVIGESGGSRSITNIGAGRLELNNPDNTFTGGVEILEGAGAVNLMGLSSSTTAPSSDFANNKGPLGTGAVILNGTQIILSSSNEVVGTQTIENDIQLNAVGSDTSKITTNSTSLLSGVISGDGPLDKTGSGTLIFSGLNDYTGTTLVASGRLLVNGTQSGNGAFTVGGILGGSGSVGASSITINGTGTLAPGAGIGSFSGGTLIFEGGSTFAYELDTDSLNGDLQTVDGDLNLTGTVNLTLAELAFGTVAADSKLTLINYSGAWNGGTFTHGGNPLLDGDSFTLGSNTWRIDYDDTAGGSNFSGEQIHAGFVTITAVMREPGTFTWDGAAGAGSTTWSAGPWIGNAAYPNMTDDVANITKNITGARTITLDASKTVGTLVIGDTNNSDAYNIDGAGTLIFAVSAGAAKLEKTSGGRSHGTDPDRINATVQLNDDLNVDNKLVGGNARMIISGAISESGGPRKIINTGVGRLELNNPDNTFTGGVEILEGADAVNLMSWTSSTTAPSSDFANNKGPLGTGTVILNGSQLILTSSANVVGTQTIENDIQLNVPAGPEPKDNQITSNSNALLSGAINGGGHLRKTGRGIITLTGDHTYTGNTTVEESAIATAALKLSNPASTNSIPHSPVIDVRSTLDVTGLLDGTLVLSPAQTLKLSVPEEGNGSSVKGSVQVTAGATLAGDGTIGGDVTVDGAISPGLPEGKLYMEDNTLVTLNGNSAYHCGFADWDGIGDGDGWGMLDASELVIAATDTPGDRITIVISGVPANFAEVNKTFEIARAISIGNFDAAAFDFDDSGFIGNGAWAIRRQGESLWLDYTAGTPDPYTAWAMLNGLSGENFAPGEDPDGDGLSNLAEFALDGNPLSGANDGKVVGQVAQVGGQSVLTLTLPVHSGADFDGSPAQESDPVRGTVYRIEASGNLVNWDVVVSEVTGPDAEAIQGALPGLTSEDWEYRTFRVSGTVSGSAKRFIRAVVE